MDTCYNLQMRIRIRPEGTPTIRYGIDQAGPLVVLDQALELNYNLDLNTGPHCFLLELAGKTNDTPEQAIVIEDIEIEGMSLDRVKWAGVYTPVYPEPWASEQTNLPKTLSGCTYMGWNGVWQLDFTVPIFTWLHQTEHLGWILT